MPRDGLRLRLFMVFAVLALALVAGWQGALWLGAAHALDNGGTAGLARAGVIGTALVLLFSLAAWLYCDERIARPLEQRALPSGTPPSSTTPEPVPPVRPDGTARAAELSRRMGAENTQLARLLGEIPVAVVLLNAANRIVLYDSQAADLLSRSGTLRLNGDLAAYLDPGTLADARARLVRTGLEVRFSALTGVDKTRLNGRMRPLDDGATLVILEHTGPRDDTADPARLVYDFALLGAQSAATPALLDRPLATLDLVAMAVDTGGPLPHRDALLHIGALRMTGSRILRREALDLRIGGAGDIPDRASVDSEAQSACTRLHDFAAGAAIVAHNAPLGMAFVRRHGAAAGLAWDQPQIDLVLVSALLFGERADHSLGALATRTGVARAAHLRRAPAQALMTAEVLQRLMPMVTERGLDTLGDLLAALDRVAPRLERLS